MHRPQPIGFFPQPASFLAVPEGLAEGEYALFMAGQLPEPLPPALAFLRLALEEDIGGALAALGGDELGRYNRFALTRDAALYAELAGQFTGAWRALLDLTANAYGVAGVAAPDPATLDGELRAAALGARARRQRQEGDTAGALATLAAAGEAARGLADAGGATPRHAGEPAVAGERIPTGGARRRSRPRWRRWRDTRFWVSSGRRSARRSRRLPSSTPKGGATGWPTPSSSTLTPCGPSPTPPTRRRSPRRRSASPCAICRCP